MPTKGSWIPEVSRTRRAGRILATLALALLAVTGLDGRQATPVQALGTYQLLGEGLDSCTAPSTTTMANMWANSGWYYWGIYIGGNQRGCSQPNLTRSWVSTVTSGTAHGVSMRWRLLPIWVGPQDPCEYGFGSYISRTSRTAEQQGVNEAKKAYNALVNLGLPSTSPIDYDLEYAGQPITSSCLNAIRWFIEGWDNQLQVAPAQKSGVYSSSCGNLDTFASIGNPPDFIDAASWGSAKSTASIPCIPDTHWDHHQRHRQWDGGHAYSHNGSTVEVDTRCANSWVVGTSSFQNTLEGC